MRKTFLSMLFVCVSVLLSVGLVSCEEKSVALGEPYIDAPSRAMRMEKVSVTYKNVSPSTEVVIDFGDGTSPVITKGNTTVTHQYQNPSEGTQPDGTYHITVTANGQAVEKRIGVYKLLALSELAKELKQPGCTRVLVMAHRANTSDKSIPENSLAAIDACIRAGVDMIETDTQATADGEVVICHDQTIDRTTNGTGDITTMTLADIRKFKLEDRNLMLYPNETMPTLREFLLAARGKIYVNLDYSPRTATTQQVMSIVQELDMMEQVLFYCNSTTKIEEVLAVSATAHAYPWYSNYPILKDRPGNYFVQCSYVPGTTPNLGNAIRDGMICTVNMLTDVPPTDVDGNQLDELLMLFPEVRVIHTDSSDKLVTALASRDRR